MIVIDDEFRRIFQAEADEHLAILSEGVLRLERDGSDAELLDRLFRSAHSLKGAAAVVGIADAARVAHVMEELLSQLRAGARAITPLFCQALLEGVDGIRDMVPALLAGEQRGGVATALERRLHEALAEAAAPTDEDAGPAAPTAEAAAPTDEDAGPAAPTAEAAAPTAETATPADPPTPAPQDPLAESPVTATPERSAVDDIVRVPVERLDELVRLVGESTAALLRLGQHLSDHLGEDPATVPEFRDLLRVLAALQERTMRTRMVTLATIAAPLQRAARDVARLTGKEVHWRLDGEATKLDRHVLSELRDPLTHLVRNAVDHGLEEPAARVAAGKPSAGTVTISAAQVGSEVEIVVRDDGRGIDVERIRVSAGLPAGVPEQEILAELFRPGFSTAGVVTEVSGRGVGLDVVERAVERIRGRVVIRSSAGVGTSFVIRVPMNLAVLPCLLVAAAGATYALPLHAAVGIVDHDRGGALAVEGGTAVRLAGEVVPVTSLAATLGRNGGPPLGPAVVLNGAARRHAFRVDELLGRRDVVVKELAPVLPRLPLLSGASVEPDGSVVLVLDAIGLVDAARRADPRAAAYAAPEAMTTVAEPAAPAGPVARVLVVDDAMTIRELQRSILERAGFDVTTAADGEQALARLAERPFDLVVTDVDMPHLDGLGLTVRIRGHPQLASLPVIIVSSKAADEDRRRGLEAGADAYLVKSAFDERDLLDAVERVLGV